LIDFNDVRLGTEILKLNGVETASALFDYNGEIADWVVIPQQGLLDHYNDRDGDVAALPSRLDRAAASSEMFVTTDAIREAVQGHELAVLAAIGIRWKAKGHIDCPYPRHGGKNDWRWDDEKRVAFCSCMGRSGDRRSHSIFDVVMTVEGIDFPAAKLRVAEIISRHDLIRNDTKPARYSKSDARSLLSPPEAHRNDALAFEYLGARLGVHVDNVPRPSTPVVGLTQLAYFDPPAAVNGKPVLVGHMPCAVFGQIDRNGAQHAHRIYLREDGRGKADLGTAANGQSRDAKKSAKVSDRASTAGRSVLWGNPDLATHVIVCEGIETAAAVALAFSAEIQTGQVMVAAAISAAGVEAFQPWPTTQKLLVAADRDEGDNEAGQPRDRAGEHAARKLCLRQWAGVECSIALPGVSGTKVDWLDVFRSDGVDAVRNGVLSALLFTPTEAEEKLIAARRGEDVALAEVARTYPVPRVRTPLLTYARGTDGKIKLHKAVWSNDGKELIPIATPFGVSARLRHVNQASAYGLRCAVQDMNDKPRIVDFDRSLLAKAGGAEVRALLLRAGLRTEADGDLVAIQLLKAADPEHEIIIVDRPGWHEIDGHPHPIFVAPDGTSIGTPEGILLELAAAVRFTEDVARAGSLEGWRSAVDAAVSVPDCLHWVLGATAGFVGPLVSLLGLDSCGINLSGKSTSGKSTAQRLAVSCWTSPDVRKKGLMQSALATANAIEPMAQAATGSVLALDELAHISGIDAGKMIYTISGGTGKVRMNADSSTRSTYSWSTFAILSCETNLEDKIRADGGEWRAGMAVRIADVDVAGINREVPVDTLRTIDQIDRNYGHAGIAFVKALIEHELHVQPSHLRDQVLKAAKILAGGEASDAAAARAARPFALLLIAGKIAISLGILPANTPISDAAQWGWEQFQHSSDAAVLDPETQMISHLSQWIFERWDVTIKRVNVDHGINNREALAWYDDEAVYIPKRRIREATGNLLKENEIGAALHRASLLARRTETDRYYVRWVPKLGKVDAYALSRQQFGRSAQTRSPEHVAVA
jgi:hypothetical protein